MCLQLALVGLRSSIGHGSSSLSCILGVYVGLGSSGLLLLEEQARRLTWVPPGPASRPPLHQGFRVPHMASHKVSNDLRGLLVSFVFWRGYLPPPRGPAPPFVGKLLLHCVL